MSRRCVIAGVCAGLAALAWPSFALAAYNETTDGDLSGNHLSPTAVALTSSGLTSISGSVTGAGSGVSTDLDYFKVTVPAGQVLTNIFVRTGTTSGGATGSFIGLFSGPVGTDPATTTGANLLGYYLYRPADIDTNILDDMATFNFNGSNPSQGFAPPLPAGDYTFWLQEGALGTFNYNFDIELNVPEPTTPALLLVGTGLLALRRNRAARGS
jgi:hypothetical protein